MLALPWSISPTIFMLQILRVLLTSAFCHPRLGNETHSLDIDPWPSYSSVNKQAPYVIAALVHFLHSLHSQTIVHIDTPPSVGYLGSETHSLDSDPWSFAPVNNRTPYGIVSLARFLHSSHSQTIVHIRVFLSLSWTSSLLTGVTIKTGSP